MSSFQISSDDCLILIAISETNSLREASRYMSCDPSGLLRKVQRLSEEDKLLFKLNSKWSLTKKGESLVSWAKKSMKTQRAALLGKIDLKLASTAWIVESLLIPQFEKINLKKNDINSLNFYSGLTSFEKGLASLDTDFVFACHPPEDPEISHKRVIKEEWITIIPKAWETEFLKSKSCKKYLVGRPFIRHINLNPEVLYTNFNVEELSTYLSTDNLITIRSAVSAGLGWSCVPKVLVSTLLKSNKVVEVPIVNNMNNTLCIWWLRERRELKSVVKGLTSWIVDASKSI